MPGSTMVLKRISQSLLRKVTPAPFGGATPATAPSYVRDSLLIFGHKDSALRLTQLEALRDAVRANPSHVRGVIIGMPFDRVERTLNEIGFDTAENLLSFNAPRSTLRFLDEPSGSLWHLPASEFARIDKAPAFTPGYPYPIPPELCFSDWLPVAGSEGLMRHRLTRRELPRPKVLTYKQTFATPGMNGYDGVAGMPDPEAMIGRLNQLYPIGLNASIFLRNLVPLIEAFGKPVTTPVLHAMICNPESRETLLEYFATHLDNLPAGEDKNRLRLAFEAIWESHEAVPPMATNLAKELFTHTYLGRDIISRHDLLVPGKLWHIDTSTHAGRFTAFCVKQDIQRMVLVAKPRHNGDLTLIFADEWVRCAIPELDSRCLGRPDVLQCYGIPDTRRLREKHGETLQNLLRGFPRHYWHITNGEEEAALFESVYPYVANARQQLAFLAWDRRLEEIAGNMREASVDLNVDGMEIHERARHSKLKRTIERGGFAID